MARKKIGKTITIQPDYLSDEEMLSNGLTTGRFNFDIPSGDQHCDGDECLIPEDSELEVEPASIDKTRDPLTLFLREIAKKKYNLLTIEQKIEITNIIKRGGQDAETARQQLLNAHVRLVVGIAKNFKRKCNVPLVELIGAGNLGLANFFAPGKIERFNLETSSEEQCCDEGKDLLPVQDILYKYASMEIAKKIRNFIGSFSIIPVSEYERNAAKNISDTVQTLENELQRQPSSQEIANRMNRSLKHVEKRRNYKREIISIETHIDNEIPAFGESLKNKPPQLETVEEKERNNEAKSIYKEFNPLLCSFCKKKLADNSNKFQFCPICKRLVLFKSFENKPSFGANSSSIPPIGVFARRRALLGKII